MSETYAPPLSRRHAVVTGGGRSLGAAIAAALAAAGADVTVMGRTRSTLDAQADLLRRTGARAQGVVCDVSEATSIARAFTEAASAFGPVDILVNNAGVSEAAPAADVTLESWNRILAVNLTGTLLCIQQVLPSMLERHTGRIVNIASVAGLKGFSRGASYCASKHGVVGLTRAVAAEVTSSGVTINAVCPGYTEDTGMFRSAVANVMSATGRAESEARATLIRQSRRDTPITVREVADTVVWLCSPGASALSGQAIAVAAGEVM